MNPDLQAVYQQMQQAQQYTIFIGYSTYAAILICAALSVLIFWKLCQIKTLLQTSAQAYLVKQAAQRTSKSSSAVDSGTPPRTDEDSRFRPKL